MSIGDKIPIIIVVIVFIGLGWIIFDTSKILENSDKKLSNTQNKEDIFSLSNNSYEFLTFDNFLVDEKYIGKISEVSFDTNELAKEFSSVISASVSDFGVNFAGKYSVITWGCGVRCQNSTIVDVSDGTIVEYGLITAYGLAYSSGSRLLIVNPKENLPESFEDIEVNITTDYYVINDDTKTLFFVEKTIPGRGAIDVCIQATASAYNFLTDEVREFSTPCAIPFGWKIIGGKVN